MPNPESTPNDAQHRDRLAAAMHAAGHGAWDWNLRDRAAWYSPGLRAMLGHDLASFPDRFETFAGAVHPEDVGRVHGAIANHLQGKAGFDLEFRMRMGDGSWKWVRARGSATFENGQAVRLNGVLAEWPLSAARDRLSMSASDRLASALEDQARIARELENARADLLRQNEDLRKARAASEAATRSKTMFLANMSHEIRTPMNAIVLSIPLLLDEGLDADERRVHGEAIQRSSEHLGMLINDVLDLSKIEAGGMVVESVPTDPLQVLADCLAVVQPLATRRRLELHAAVRGPVPMVIHTDPHRFRQILMNLLSNAIKFTEHGGVTVDVDLVRGPAADRLEAGDDEAPPAATRLRVLVTDSGMGIEPRQLTRIFQPFAQGDESTTRRFGGTGLGLAISRRLARLLGGDITVRSEPGRGSTFTVEIGTGPIDASSMIEVMPQGSGVRRVIEPDAGDGRALRVLLAEDGEDNQRLLVHHLKRAGMTVTVAANGREAVDLALASRRTGRPFEIVLMDMQMPELDGYEATARLRQEGWTGPVIALTAHAMAGDRERCLQAGCDDYLAKPIDRNRLLEIVRRAASHGA